MSMAPDLCLVLFVMDDTVKYITKLARVNS
jgi:hypothetical protein